MSELIILIDNGDVYCHHNNSHFNLTETDAVHFQEDGDLNQFVEDVQLLTGFTGKEVSIYYEGIEIVHDVIQAPFMDSAKDKKSFVKMKVESELSERLSFKDYDYAYQYFENEKAGSSMAIDIINRVFVKRLIKAFSKKNVFIKRIESLGSLLYSFQKNRDGFISPHLVMLFGNKNSSPVFVYTGGHESPYFVRYANKYPSIEMAYTEGFKKSIAFGKQRFSNAPDSVVCIGSGGDSIKESHPEDSEKDTFIDMPTLLLEAHSFGTKESNLISSEDRITAVQKALSKAAGGIVLVFFVLAAVLEVSSIVYHIGNTDKANEMISLEVDDKRNLQGEVNAAILKINRIKLIETSQAFGSYYSIIPLTDYLPEHAMITRLSASEDNSTISVVINGKILGGSSDSYNNLESYFKSISEDKRISFNVTKDWKLGWIQKTSKISDPFKYGIPFNLRGQIK